MSNDAPAFLKRYQSDFEKILQDYLALPKFKTIPSTLYEALCYVLTTPAKRIRPIIMFLVADMLKVDKAILSPFALAIEMLHTYSLVHDDMPAMDDDAFRRGMPTCHIKYGEGNAMLVGDALQNEAFACIATTSIHDSKKIINILQLITQCSGVHGMIAGQFLDIANETKSDRCYLKKINALKTGRLFYFTIMVVAECMREPMSSELEIALKEYANALGSLFQAKDDVLDIEQDASSDNVSLAQLEADVLKYYDEANTALSFFGDKATQLLELNNYLINRVI